MSGLVDGEGEVAASEEKKDRQGSLAGSLALLA